MNKKKNVTIILFLLVSTILIACITACGKKTETEMESESRLTEVLQTKEVQLNEEQLEILEKAHVITGLDDYQCVEKNKIPLEDLVIFDPEIISDLVILDQDVDYNKPGEYPVRYEFLIDQNKLMELCAKQKQNWDPVKDADLLLAKAEYKISVLTKAEAEKSAGAGNLITPESAQAVAQTNQQQIANGVSQSQNSQKSSSNGTGKTNDQTATSSHKSESKQNSSSSSGTKSDSGQSKDQGTTNKPVTSHTHTWVEQTKTVHHDATGHYETRVVSEAWDEQTGHYEAHTVCDCGIYLDGWSSYDVAQHVKSDAMAGIGGGYKYQNVWVNDGTIHHDAVTEQVWVEDSPAWDETVGTGTYICSGCGATK